VANFNLHYLHLVLP